MKRHVPNQPLSSFSSSAPGCPACRNGTATGGLHATDRCGRTFGRFGRRCRTRCPSRRGCAIGVRRRRIPPRPGCRSRRRNNAQNCRLLHRGRAKAGSRRPSGSSYYIKECPPRVTLWREGRPTPSYCMAKATPPVIVQSVSRPRRSCRRRASHGCGIPCTMALTPWGYIPKPFRCDYKSKTTSMKRFLI